MWKKFKNISGYGESKEKNDKARPKLNEARRSKSASELHRDSDERKRSFSIMQPANGGKKITSSRKNHQFFSSQVITKREVNPQEVDDFITAIRKSAEQCKDHGGYFRTLDGDNLNVLKKVAEAGQFNENITFLEKFNDYMTGKLTATQLYSSLADLNLDDSDDKKYLTRCANSNSLDTAQNVKETYQEIAGFIFEFLSFNLSVKRSAIQQALQTVNSSHP